MSTIHFSPLRDDASPHPLNRPASNVSITFWQHPFVQNILPFLTSLMMHVAILVLSIATYQVIKIESAKTIVVQTDPGQGITAERKSDSLPKFAGYPGIGDDNRPVAQDKVLVVPNPTGYSETLGKDWFSRTRGGGSGDALMTDAVIGLGLGSGFGEGKKGWGPGKGDGAGPGDGDGGPLAPYGIPSLGNRDAGFMPGNITKNVQRVVFVCDATGSMMPQFDALRVELRKSIDALRPPQSFNVVFFQENAPPPLDKNLLFASPDNKRRMHDYIDKYTPRGPTDPNPAIRIAFAMHPDVIFFLCDPSDFPDPRATIDLFGSLNDGNCRVNTIAFIEHDEQGEAMLRLISSKSKGTFCYVSEQDMAK